MHFSARTNVMLIVMFPHGIFTAVFVVHHASFKKYANHILYNVDANKKGHPKRGALTIIYNVYYIKLAGVNA